MTKLYTEKPFEYGNQKTDNQNYEASGNGWFVYKNKGKFFFSYISGQLAGKKTEDIEITESDCQNLKDGTATFDGICHKYNIS